MALAQPATGSVQWSLGELMWKARKDAGLDQQAVAEALGVSRALVGHWENDRSEPSYRRLVKFAEVTNFPLDVLLSAMGYKPEMPGDHPDLSVIKGKGKSSARSLPLFASSV